MQVISSDNIPLNISIWDELIEEIEVREERLDCKETEDKESWVFWGRMKLDWKSVIEFNASIFWFEVEVNGDRRH